jgi:ADP-ribose pyrophosphatase YjhB (NUDIX family)
MGRAARAIIIENGNLLVMHRNKYGSEYFTLVGGRETDGEAIEQTLAREIREETGLQVTKAKLLFVEEHPAPYNEQYIFLCEVAPHNPVALEGTSEEANMNKYDMNIHRPQWVNARSFANLPFRTPALQEAILRGLKKGWPKEPVKL